jgi:Kdo2-lipid IVA lauroyltransferase/acyltransferase
MNPLVGLMRLLALLPLSWLRGLGWLLGQILFRTSARRGRVVATNIALCFPELPPQQQRALRQQHFVYFAQSFLDRAWLWHAPEKWVAQRFQFEGHFHNFQDPSPLIVLAPHFVGLDAGGLAMTLLQQAHMSFVYVPLKNKSAEAWMTEGRKRSGRVLTIARREGPMPMIKSLKDGWRLHFSPDMDFGINGSVWSAFFWCESGHAVIAVAHRQIGTCSRVYRGDTHDTAGLHLGDGAGVGRLSNTRCGCRHPAHEQRH